MDSIGKDCGELKRDYDACFNKWYAEKFLKGLADESDHVPCADLFHSYRACVEGALKEKNIDMDEVLKKVLNTDEEKKLP